MSALKSVEIHGVSKSFDKGRVRALDNVSVQIASGETLVLLGHSGCGKTTLLRSIAGLERPDHGEIKIAQKTVFQGDRSIFTPPNKRDLGMVFQNYALWPHLTVAENVAFPFRVRGEGKAVRLSKAQELLDTVRCGHLGQRYPNQLSGGQQQRIAVARSLAANPAVVLFDEPLSNIDAQLRHTLRNELREYQRRLGFTAVYVTHDQVEAFELGTRVAVMDGGVIMQLGTPETVHQYPATRAVAEFLGIGNRFEVKSTPEGLQMADGTLLPLRNAYPREHGPGFAYVRAEALRLNAPDAGAMLGKNGNAPVTIGTGRIGDVVFSGSRLNLIVDLPIGKVDVVVDATDRTQFVAGDAVSVQVAETELLFYGPSGRIAAAKVA